MNDVLLQVNNLKKHFPVGGSFSLHKTRFVKAVDGVNLTVHRGETLGIVGESGCGKSTLGQVILQLQRATEGEVIFEGEDLCKLNEAQLRKRRHDFQIVFQDPYSSINPRKNIETIITEPMLIHKIVSHADKKKKAVELLNTVGLGEHQLRRMPHEFSGGQRQRIGIARAISLNPKLIVCDEPVSALDVSIQAQILNLLKKLQQEQGIAYIFIAHGLPAVRHISDRIAVMYLGRIVEIADKNSLFAHPMHPYTEALLSAVPIPNPNRTTKRIVLEGDIPSPVNLPSGCPFHPRCVHCQPKCKEEVPPFAEYDQGHFCACHFPLAKKQRSKFYIDSEVIT